MEDSPRDDIRRLLKSFGIQADEAIVRHLARLGGSPQLQIRLTLQDMTDYGQAPPESRLHLEMDGRIRGGDS
jgi:hypothetical protein